ncbi:MAG: hypothetical protein CFE24_03300 [Flavobacterium sp. BFFFF2]|nr:MAG: hypothetical protein CFE24_03300 [Flavobacterium sp. BFFFF2]
MPQEFKAPLGLKVFLVVVVIVLFFYNFYYVGYRQNKNKSEFFKRAFTTKVISSDSYEGRTIEYQLENGLKIYFLLPIDSKIELQDLVQKSKETYLYNVYRKNNENEYKYYTTYNFGKMQ